MITKEIFTAIHKEIRDTLQLSLDNLKAKSPENYILFLADGEYFAKYESSFPRLNPYVIDNRIDYYKDKTRLTFLANFLTNFYSFPTNQVSTDDNEQRLHMELMVYSHVWESKPFLKKLYRLAHICNGEEYNWNVTIPDMGKHDFIRNDIRSTFGKSGNNIEEIIKKGFHTSLRNAFAHSEYSFDNDNNLIHLDNYNGQSWELRNISFNDWSIRFIYSTLLSYFLLEVTSSNRSNLIKDFGTDTFTIRHPSSGGNIKDVKITYNSEHDVFSFQH